jgi:hypothetical protein
MTWVSAEFRSLDLDRIASCVVLHMRALFLVLALLVAGTSAQADPQRFRAGITRTTVQDVVPFDTLIVYPTDAAEVPFQDGPYTIAASRDAPIASGARFPVVLFSHGGGRTIKAGGSSLLMPLFSRPWRARVLSWSRRFTPDLSLLAKLSKIDHARFTRRSLQCWPIHASRCMPIPTALA